MSAFLRPIHNWFFHKINLLSQMDQRHGVLEDGELADIINETDIHAPYWNMIQGEAEYYYEIGESFVIGILENSGISFQQTVEQSFELRKES